MRGWYINMLDNELIDGYIGELEDLIHSMIDKLRELPSMLGGIMK